MVYTYGSFPKVKLGKFLLIFPLLLAGAWWLVGGAVARDWDLDLHVYPNPFFAGYKSQPAYVAFKIPAGGTATIYVYDFDGNRVRTLFEGTKYAPGEHEREWDGRDNNGDLVAPGPYVIVLELTIQGELYRDTFVAVANR